MNAERFPGSDDVVRDALTLFFGDKDFQPLLVSNDLVVTGSVRGISGYDAFATCDVEIIEFVGLIQDDSRYIGVHRLIASWGDGSICELDLDTNTIVMEGDRMATPEEDGWERFRLTQAIESVVQ